MRNNVIMGDFTFFAPVQVHKFYFEKVGGLDKNPRKVIQNIGALALQNKNIYTLQLEVNLQIGGDKDKLFVVEAILGCMIEFSITSKENEKYLNSAVAILYSYLRPLVAQMTTMAKLPPLDLQPLNFEDIKIKVEHKEKSISKNGVKQ